MTENLNLTELIEQLQQIVKDGRFEYTPTNIESVKYNSGFGACVTLQGAATDEDLEEMQRDLDRAQEKVDESEREIEDLEEKLREARERIAELKSQLKTA